MQMASTRILWLVLLLLSVGFPRNVRSTEHDEDEDDLNLDDDDDDDDEFPYNLTSMTTIQPSITTDSLNNSNGTFEEIIGGVDAGKHEFPFAAALYPFYVTPGPFVDSTCSGSLIHPKVVLTAAHCIGDGGVVPRSWVYIGQNDLHGIPNGEKAVKVRVARTIVHPKYSEDDFENGNDIALVILEYPVGIQPVRIETLSNVSAEETHETVIAIGYGQTAFPGGSGARFLQKIYQPLHPICDCYHRLQWQGFLSSEVASRQICYYPPSRRHRVCFGDSGGPMLTGSNLDAYKIIGIVSFGPGCNEQLPDIYTRVSAFAGWINSNSPGKSLSSIGGPTVALIGVPESEWMAYPVSAQGNRACRERGWAGGYNVKFAPPGFDFGAICFNTSVAVLVKTSATRLNDISTNWRLSASRVCYSQGHLAGIWTGESYKDERIILCLLKNKHVHYVEPLKSELDALSMDKDRAGYLFAMKLGFRFGLYDGSESDDRRVYYLTGSRAFQWNYSYSTKLADSYEQQSCLYDCPISCPYSSLGNGVCDTECNFEECEYDKGDCEAPKSLRKVTPICNCPDDWLGDNECDATCNNVECNFDKGDCTRGCDEWCKPLMGNNVCNAECNTKECNFDNGDCVSSACQCPLSWLGDGHCDQPCNNAPCGFDKGDCSAT